MLTETFDGDIDAPLRALPMSSAGWWPGPTRCR